MRPVKVRIPPSPTGYMHIATARMALYNYIFAKQNNGKTILRLEDSDRERSKPEFIQDILDCLKWLGLDYDEGPYYQSQRIDIYRKYLQKLLDADLAYWCFCSSEDLEAEKQYNMSQGAAPVYSGKCATLTKDEAKDLLEQGKRAVIRFRTPKKKVSFNDVVRGKIDFDGSLIGDFVIAKDLDNALYNFIVVVDDFEMGVTHVIRGEDHISNTPKQIFLQEALGIERPVYAHMPMVLGPDKTKLSKRHGAVGVNEYLKAGYLPETLVNFMAFLGWNPGTEKEFYTLQELIADFSLEKIQKGAAIFNAKRLDFLNGYYIRQKPTADLTRLCIPFLIASQMIEPSGEPDTFTIKATGERIKMDFLTKVVQYHQPRLRNLSEIVTLSGYFFQERLDYDKSILKWKDESYDDVVRALDVAQKLMDSMPEADWTKENLESSILGQAEEFSLSIGRPGKDRGFLLWPLRVSLCGQKMSIGPFEMAEVLGKAKTLARVLEAKAFASSAPATESLL